MSGSGWCPGPVVKEEQLGMGGTLSGNKVANLPWLENWPLRELRSGPMSLKGQWQKRDIVKSQARSLEIS